MDLLYMYTCRLHLLVLGGVMLLGMNTHSYYGLATGQPTWQEQPSVHLACVFNFTTLSIHSEVDS